MKKTFIGTKTVKAEPMSAECANSMGYKVPTELMGTMGYEVEYEDGYKSWCPKDVLENHYKVAETYIDRMKIEYADLTERAEKLSEAIDCPADECVKKFGAQQFMLMSLQFSYMTSYAIALQQRIQLALSHQNGNK